MQKNHRIKSQDPLLCLQFCASLNRSLLYLTSAFPSAKCKCLVLASNMPCISDITVIYDTLSPLFSRNKTIKVMCCLGWGNLVKLFPPFFTKSYQFSYLSIYNISVTIDESSSSLISRSLLKAFFFLFIHSLSKAEGCLRAQHPSSFLKTYEAFQDTCVIPHNLLQ